MEWLGLDARLEAKKNAKLRRQQRELKRLQRERDEHERQQRKLDARCAEMHAEELLSIAMAHMYAQDELRRALEYKREADMKMFCDVDRARKRAQTLGLSLSTPGATGPDRLQVLEARITDREAALQRAAAATQRLDALPHKRNILKRFMAQCAATSLVTKLERAVSEQQCERVLSLIAPLASSSIADTRVNALLNHESANGLTPVLAAIFAKKLSVLRRLLELGASPSHESSWGMTPLLASVASDNVVAANMLLIDFRADANAETMHHVRAVHVAAEKGRLAVLTLLLHNSADPSCATTGGNCRTPLIQAVLANQLEAVNVLLAFGADREIRDASGCSAAEWATRLAYPHITARLNSTVPTAELYRELFDDDAADASGMMRRAVQQRTRTLETAMRDCNVQRLRTLLDDPIHSVNYEDAHGDTPFLVLCRVGSYDDVCFALAHHTLPMQQSRNGTTALIAASYAGKRDVLELLLRAGGDLRTRDFRGWDSVRHLTYHDHVDVVEALAATQPERVHARPRPFMLGEPLPSTAVLHARVSIVAVAPLLPASEPVTRSSADTEVTRAIRQLTGCQRTSSSNERERDCNVLTTNSNSSGDVDSDSDTAERAMSRKWHLRQHVLKHNRARRTVFDDERTRILEIALRGRRNGLVAPLPHDISDQRTRPLCDNCTQLRAHKRCIECAQVLCDKCHARLHELAQRRHHTFAALESFVCVSSALLTTGPAHDSQSLQHSVADSVQQIASMRELLLGNAATVLLTNDAATHCSHDAHDSEVERFERAKRVARAKRVTQQPLNVPVAAAKRAARCGDGVIFAQPAELALVDLYIAQRRFDKATEVLALVQQRVSEALGSLHPTALKVTTKLARVYKETNRAALCVETMQHALALFESVLPADDCDLLLGVSVLLAGLEDQVRYDDAVRVCRYWFALRQRALGRDHSAVHDICARLDEFVAKRELISMTDEDCVYRALLEHDAERAANALRDSERRVAAFRYLLLDDPPGLADFMVFCRREFADDLVAFWIAVERLKQDGLDAKAFRAAAVYIFITYIKSRRVRVVTAVQRKRIKKTITTPDRRLPATVYDDVLKVVTDVVYTGVYARYLASQHAGDE